MASSRWKRFAFFDRHTLNIPNEVLEDVVPRNGSDINASLAKDNVSLVVTTAGLPLTTRPLTISRQALSSPEKNDSSASKEEALDAMWSSLVTCSTVQLESAVLEEEGTANSTAQFFASRNQNNLATSPLNASATTTTTAMDGLVLAFLSSPETDFVHCIDITVRCNPPMSPMQNNDVNDSNGHSPELEDMDGWRGYLGPFSSKKPSTTNNISTSNNQSTQQQQQQQPSASTEAGNANSSLNNGDEEDRSICDLAVCRVTSASGSKRSDDSSRLYQHSVIHLACLSKNCLVIWEDPHLYLSCRRPLMHSSANLGQEAKRWELSRSMSATNTATDGDFCTVSTIPGVAAIGTQKGAVLVYVYNPQQQQSSSTSHSAGSFRRYLRIPPPLNEKVSVVSVKISEMEQNKICVFVVYNRADTSASTAGGSSSSNGSSPPPSHSTSAGICCYEMPMPSFVSSGMSISAPSARHDLDGRYLASQRLVDASFLNNSANNSQHYNARLTVARPDGLYTFSQTERVSVSPIDGNKLTVALVPHTVSSGGQPNLPNPSAVNTQRRPLDSLEDNATSLGYALLASTDEKSGRDAVDVYDSTNKLVAFHLLLSPGHKALRAAGVATPSTLNSDGSVKGGRSSAVVITSGGSLVTLTEKRTSEKVELLVQKHLYSAAVVIAYSDPSFSASEISGLYRKYAEHLYRKGDLNGAVDQYIHTIGNLESSHVIFRFLDAPKIPLLVKYLNQLRERGRATAVHDELLRTCYLKLNDAEAAEAIASSASTVNRASLASVLSNLTANPKEALSTICALEAHEAVEILVIHGASLARVLPQETAGVVVALCVGTFSPRTLAQGSRGTPKDLKTIVEGSSPTDGERPHEPYPVELFASSFIEQPKMLRLILAHCNRNKCPLTPALRRTLLELTLEEWNLANRTGDTEAQKLRHKEAVVALTDSHAREIGDYDALVICQLAEFDEGQLILYERLQMTPMLLERYAKDGSEKARRQMMVMSQTDPEILPDVLGYFVAMASERLANADSKTDDDESYAEETEDLLDDIQATLALARRQGAPPVRIARILAGEGTGQFSPKPTAISNSNRNMDTVPLSVALEYVGSILEESRHEGARLKSEVEELSELCNSTEREIDSLLRTSRGLSPFSPTEKETTSQSINIEEMYNAVRQEGERASSTNTVANTLPREAFWREMNMSEGADRMDTIARFFAKGVMR